MKIYCFLFALLAASANFRAKAEETCADRALNCYTELYDSNNITQLLLQVQSEKEIETFCKEKTEIMKCIADNEHCLATDYNTAYMKLTNGVHQFYLNLCPPGTQLTEKYKLHAECFKFIKKEMAFCDSDIIHLDSAGIKKEDICCSLMKNELCMTKATRERCGKEAAEVMQEILRAFYKGYTEQCNKRTLNCLDDEDNGGYDEDHDNKHDNEDDKHGHDDEKHEDGIHDKHSSGSSSLQAVGLILSTMAAASHLLGVPQ